MEISSWKLPHQITFSILSRLPVKSVMRCRCVCKAWRARTSSRRFINMHLSETSAEYPSLLFETFDLKPHTGGIPGCLHDICYGKHLLDNVEELGVITQPVTVTALHQVPSDAIIGLCNGLLCLSHHSRTINTVCNPLTGETIELPKSRKFDVGNGFGYHARTDEYKVIGFTFKGYFHLSKFTVDAEVYTLGSSSSWRSKGGVPFVPLTGTCNVLVEGALHWLAYFPVDTTNVVIASFDIADEEFRMLPLPPQVCPDYECEYIRIQELGGSLCVVDFTTRDRANIWLMKEYGVKESWTKQYVVPFPLIPYCVMVDRVHVLWILKSGKILVCHNKDKLIVYDPENNQVRDVEFEVPAHTCSLFVYRGSLVSPFVDR